MPAGAARETLAPVRQKVTRKWLSFIRLGLTQSTQTVKHKLLNLVHHPASHYDSITYKLMLLRIGGSFLCLIALTLAAGCNREKKQEERRLEVFFADWLKSHGESNVVHDAAGVGIAGNNTRLKASLYGSNHHKNESYDVEVEFKIRVSAGSEIIEYVAGVGKTEHEAINDALLNFVLSTFHVVYKTFINPSDSHQTLDPITINGRTRQIAMGDLMTRSGTTNEIANVNAIRSKIRAAIAALPLNERPHWIKIVYGQVKRKPVTVSATLDNQGHEGLTAMVEALSWPEVKDSDYFIVKEFIAIK